MRTRNVLVLALAVELLFLVSVGISFLLLAGYWVGGQFQKFPVGQYTVVAFDAWGDRAVGHFQVVA